MAIRSNKSKGIKAISKKDKYLNRMKALTKYLVNPSEELLDIIVENKVEARKLKFRSITYLIKYPKLMYYINKHLNSLYNFENFNNREWFITIAEICRMYNIINTNSLYFTKFKTDESNGFVSIIKKYSKELNISEPSNSEINAFYILFKNGIITEENIQQLKLVIDGKDKSSATEKKLRKITGEDILPFQSTKQEKPIELKFENLSPEVQKFSNMVKNYIKSRNTCKNCPLTNKTPIILDTNLTTPGPVDLFILGLNPDKSECKDNLPFTTTSGKILRRFLTPLVEKHNLTYVISNCILCNTKNIQEIPSIKNVANNCKVIIEEIKQNFSPRLNIVLGGDAMKALGIKGGVTKLNGQMMDNYFIMIHPEMILRNSNNLPKFEKAFESLNKLLLTNQLTNTNSNINTQPTTTLHNIPPSKIITRFGPNLTLFDIKHIGEQIIYIMNNELGEKKYLIEDILFPIYIKDGNYKDCKIIDNEPQAVAFLTAQQRIDLNKTLHHNLRSMIDTK